MAGQSSKGTKKIDILSTLLDEDAEPKSFTFPLLSEITNSFSNELKIGSGGFAVVYKGVLKDQVVAVKRLSNTSLFEEAFRREVECLMKVRHKNIVRFLGYCFNNQGIVASNNGDFSFAEEQQRLLCFEYLPKGSLHDYIADASGGLDWRTRYQIIKGTCEGLQYLHQTNIVHLDLKPSNVLLDEQMIPKITDFGLSRCFKDDQTQLNTTNVGGTWAYLAPEFDNRTITYKYDLYSLGVMIREIITGERGYQGVDSVLSSWSNRCDESQLEQIRVCTKIGLECSKLNPGKRPKSMKHIMDRLAETESWQGADQGVSSGVLSFSPSVLCFPFKKGCCIYSPLHLTNNTDEYVAFLLDHKHRDTSITSALVKVSEQGIVPPRSTCTLVLETQYIRNHYELEEMGIEDLVLRSTTFRHEQIREHEQAQGLKPGAEYYYSDSVKHEVALKAFCTPPRGVVMSTLSSKRISPGIQTLPRYFDDHRVYSLDTVQAKQWIIVGENHGKVIIWDNRTQKQVHSMKVSEETVTCVKFIAPQQWLVLGTKNGYIHVYNCETKMQKITSFRATDMYLKSLAVHPTQPYLLSSDHCGMKLWDWDKSFECIHNFENEHSKEICQVAFNLNDTIASASEDHLVKVWSIGSPKSNYTISGHSNKVNCLAFFSCDDLEYLVTGSDDQTAKIWDMRTKICIHTLEVFETPVTCVVYEPNLQILITGSKDGYTYYWNALRSYRLERIIQTGGRNGAVNGLACLMGRVVIGREKSAVIMDIDNVNSYQEQYKDDYNEPQLTGGATCEVTSAAGSSIQQPLDVCFHGEDDPCSLHITNKTDEHMAFCLTEYNGKCGLPIDCPPGRRWDVSPLVPYGIVPPRSTYILFLPLKGPMTSKGLKRNFELILYSSISGDNRYMFLFASQFQCDEFFGIAQDTGNTVHKVLVIGDTAKPVISPRVKITCKQVTHVNSYDRYDVYSMDAHPTESWIITGHKDGEIFRWNYNSPSIATDHDKKKPEGLHRTAGDKPIIDIGSLEGTVRSVKFVATKKWILAAGSVEGVIHVYSYHCVSGLDEIAKVTTFRAPDGYSVRSLAVHPTQPYVALSKHPLNNHETEFSLKRNLEMDDKEESWECAQTFDLLNNNSTRSAAHQGIEQVGSTESPRSDHTLPPGHSDSVNCLHYFTRDGRQYLITGSDDCTAKIWDVQKKACIHTMAHEAIMSPVTSAISLLPHRPYLLTGSYHGTVQVWRSTDFRLERTINFGGGGPVQALACLMGSPRVVVAQKTVVSIMEIGNEVEAVAISELNK